jgi:hypothetical protein
MIKILEFDDASFPHEIHVIQWNPLNVITDNNIHPYLKSIVTLYKQCLYSEHGQFYHPNNSITLRWFCKAFPIGRWRVQLKRLFG